MAVPGSVKVDRGRRARGDEAHALDAACHEAGRVGVGTIKPGVGVGGEGNAGGGSRPAAREHRPDDRGISSHRKLTETEAGREVTDRHRAIVHDVESGQTRGRRAGGRPAIPFHGGQEILADVTHGDTAMQRHGGLAVHGAYIDWSTTGRIEYRLSRGPIQTGSFANRVWRSVNPAANGAKPREPTNRMRRESNRVGGCLVEHGQPAFRRQGRKRMAMQERVCPSSGAIEHGTGHSLRGARAMPTLLSIASALGRMRNRNLDARGTIAIKCAPIQ